MPRADAPHPDVPRWTLREAGRLDAVAARAIGISRGEFRRWLMLGELELEGRRIRERDKALRVSAGQVLTASQSTPPSERAPLPSSETLSILQQAPGHEPGWIVTDKPAGVATHPLRGDETQTILNRVVQRYPWAVGVGEGGLRSGVAHRLDVTTSGALAVALHDDAWARLKRAWDEGAVVKTYDALVVGQPGDSILGRHARWLRVAQHQPARVSVATAHDDGARRCTLTVEAIAVGPSASWVTVALETGFLHQVRVMLADLGHPLLGDELYGYDASQHPGAGLVGRPMLHARRLAVLSEGLDATAPYPEDFRGLARAMGISLER